MNKQAERESKIKGRKPFSKSTVSLKKFRSRLDERLDYIKSLVCLMGQNVEKTISDAKEIIVDRAEAKEKWEAVENREEKVNELQLKVSKACFRALASQAPVAKDLRMILTCLYANTDLERMGDLAINITRRGHKMEDTKPLENSYGVLDKMFNAVSEMVSLSLDAFSKESASIAQKVIAMDDVVDSCRSQIKKESKIVMQSQKNLVSSGVEFIIVSGSLERIADHSTNIAEEIIFLQTGCDIRHART